MPTSLRVLDILDMKQSTPFSARRVPTAFRHEAETSRLTDVGKDWWILSLCLIETTTGVALTRRRRL